MGALSFSSPTLTLRLTGAEAWPLVSLSLATTCKHQDRQLEISQWNFELKAVGQNEMQEPRPRSDIKVSMLHMLLNAGKIN